MDPLDLIEGKAGVDRLGSIHVRAAIDFRSKGQVIGRFVVAFLVIAAVVAATLYLSGLGVWTTALVVAGLAAYSAMAYFVDVQVDHDELGPGGIFDHPLRWSDNVNRSLVSLTIMLLPGRLLAASFVDGFNLFAHRQLPQDRILAKIEADERRGDKAS